MLKLSTKKTMYDEESGNIKTKVQLNDTEVLEYNKACNLNNYDFSISDIVENIFITSENPYTYYGGIGCLYVNTPSFSKLQKNNIVVITSSFGRDC